MPPEDAVGIPRAAGVKRAFVSSSGDEVTQKLYQVAPDPVVPVPRPYRQRGETSTWMRDETVIAHVEARLAEVAVQIVYRNAETLARWPGG